MITIFQSGMTDNERLLRRQLTEATRRSDQLEIELQRQQEVIRHKEEILRRTNVINLHSWIKLIFIDKSSFQSELAALRRENASLRQGFGGGHPDHRTQRVAQNLLTAATNAESSIRYDLAAHKKLFCAIFYFCDFQQNIITRSRGSQESCLSIRPGRTVWSAPIATKTVTSPRVWPRGQGRAGSLVILHTILLTFIKYKLFLLMCFNVIVW